MFDYFVADLYCPNCGTFTPATTLTNMQTYIRGLDANGSALPIGYSFDPADLTTAHITNSGYALISLPVGEVRRLMDVWFCPACKTEQWAVVEISQQKIASIEAISIDRTTFEAAHFISEGNADFLAEAITGITQTEIAERKLNSVDILKERLK